MIKGLTHFRVALTFSVGVCVAQMATGAGSTMGAPPSSFDASGSSATSPVDDPAHRGEAPNPQLFGTEIPLIDPSSDTVKYNGGVFDVGNNAAVRARFEKFLEQEPDSTSDAENYRHAINEILRKTQGSSYDKKYKIGGETLIFVGKTLYEISAYPGDGQQSGTLASAIVSALDVQREMLKREEQNKKLDSQIDDLLKIADGFNNSNERRGKQLNVNKIAHAVKKAAENESIQAANIAKNEASFIESKINFQATLVSMLSARRFDHVVIGARVYRHLFRDGDVRLNSEKDSQMNQLFSGTTGLPLTVHAMDSAANNMRIEVDKAIKAVQGMLERNKLGQATQRLIEAVAIGEYMQSVATFPAESRRRIAAYWNLRKRVFSALNARDYATVEDVVAKMKDMDADFDDSAVRTFITAKRRQSDLALRNAKKALSKGDEESFNKYIAEAVTIWPTNPNLKEGEKLISGIDAGDPVKDEFSRLYEGKEYRRIAREREHFKIVNTDPELAKKYEEVITLVMKMDGMLEQIREVAQQDAAMGPCIAYEKLVKWREDDPNFAADVEMTLTQKDMESGAHDFVQALRDGIACEERAEYGPALSCYYRAQCKYPHSTLAREGIKRVTNVISGATF